MRRSSDNKSLLKRRHKGLDDTRGDPRRISDFADITSNGWGRENSKKRKEKTTTATSGGLSIDGKKDIRKGERILIRGTLQKRNSIMLIKKRFIYKRGIEINVQSWGGKCQKNSLNVNSRKKKGDTSGIKERKQVT